jgi:hypothetical protein
MPDPLFGTDQGLVGSGKQAGPCVKVPTVFHQGATHASQKDFFAAFATGQIAHISDGPPKQIGSLKPINFYLQMCKGILIAAHDTRFRLQPADGSGGICRGAGVIVYKKPKYI